ncbi:MAG TPA: hypothetical protein PLF84_00060 [Bryobacteraceae bacterium]|nr:hypothetical protein [Bryobacteraceae bacterium]
MEERAAVQFREISLAIDVPGPHLGHGADSSNRRDAVADGATRTVERRSKTVFRGFYFREILKPNPEQFKLGGADSTKRIARKCFDLSGLPEQQGDSQQGEKKSCGQSRHICHLLDLDRPTHQIVTGAARPRTLEHEFAFLLGDEPHADFSPALRWNCDFDASTGDAEPMVGVVAGQHELDKFSLLQRHFGRIERESFSGDRYHAIRFPFRIALSQQ